MPISGGAERYCDSCVETCRDDVLSSTNYIKKECEWLPFTFTSRRARHYITRIPHTSLDKNKLNIGTDTGSDDIPFILCTPTKNEDDDTAQSQDATTGDKESSELITFSLKPRRRLNEDVEQIAISDMLSESFLNDIQKDSANKTMESTTLLSPRSSPLPTFRSIDVMITPPPAPRPQMLCPLKPRDSQEVHRRGRHDDTSPSKLTGPPFPILGRRDDHRHLWQQQQQRPKLCRPILVTPERR
eukprot:scaffold7615_cov86-Skeletonema_dohrnii-CCMP3373.AAC.6